MGDRSEIIGVAPVAIVAGGSGTANYHFTIARDQVRFFRDSLIPIVWADVEPNVTHTYRLELVGTALYVWYIDGDVVDSGEPEAAYPPMSNPRIVWQARSHIAESTTQWDYIRFGRRPADHSGDFDSSGTVDIQDFYFFAECVADRGNGPGVPVDPGCEWADMDQDDDVDYHDFALFQRAFTTPQ